MTNITIDPKNSSPSNYFSPKPTINNKNLFSQVVISGIFAGSIHQGLYWAGLGTEFKGTPLASALFFGLTPAVHSAMQAIFKNYLVDQSCKDSKQFKAQSLVATVSAAFCTPICNTIIYNLFAEALNLRQWEVSTVFTHQINFTLYYPAVISGMNMMATTAIKTILTAQGLSEKEIEEQMSLTNPQLTPLGSSNPV